MTMLLLLSCITWPYTENKVAQSGNTVRFPKRETIGMENLGDLSILDEINFNKEISEIAWSSDGSQFVVLENALDSEPSVFHIFQMDNEQLVLQELFVPLSSGFTFDLGTLGLLYSSTEGIYLHTLAQPFEDRLIFPDNSSNPFAAPYTAMDINDTSDLVAVARSTSSDIYVFNWHLTNSGIDTSDWLASFSVTGGVPVIAFHPLQPIIAYGRLYDDVHTVHLWNFETGESWTLTSKTVGSRSSEVVAITFLPNSDLMASGGCDGTVRLWNLRTTSEIALVDDPITRSTLGDIYDDPGCVSAVAFSPDGNLLVNNSGNRINLSNPTSRIVFWDVSHHTFASAIQIPVSDYPQVAFHPNGDLIAVSGANSIQFWGVPIR